MKKVVLFLFMMASSLPVLGEVYTHEMNTFNCNYEWGVTKECVDPEQFYENSRIACDSIVYGKDAVILGITDEKVKKDFLIFLDLIEKEKSINGLTAYAISTYQEKYKNEKRVSQKAGVDTGIAAMNKLGDYFMKEDKDIGTQLLGGFIRFRSEMLDIAITEGDKNYINNFLNECSDFYLKACYSMHKENTPTCE